MSRRKDPIVLTPREAEILDMTELQSMSPKRIAESLGWKDPRIVSTYLRLAREKRRAAT